MSRNKLFQVFSMLWHYLSAWNTGGEGIHSPRLFYLVRHLFYDKASLYSWKEIEQCRQSMLCAPKLVHIRDFGTGQDRDELVMQIARKSVMTRPQAQLIGRLLNYMTGDEYVSGRKRPLHIVELGTSLGITTAYMASVGSENQVVTFEGSEEIAAMAELNWQKMGICNIEQKIGNIDDTLYIYARETTSPIDFVLMDANHSACATLRYFEWLLPHMDADGMMVVDDIRLSKEMYRAWNTIASHQGVSATMDLGRMGLVFFYPKLVQKQYRLRI